jgi:hypothetical protein
MLSRGFVMRKIFKLTYYKMKSSICILTIVLCLFGTNVFAQTITAPKIIGTWYGLKDGSPVTVVFRNDQTMSIHADAFSSLSFTCQYKIDSCIIPMDFYLAFPRGMSCDEIAYF